MTVRILAPHTAPIPPTFPGTTVSVYDPTQPIPQEYRDAKALIVWGMPPHLLKEAARTLPQLEVVQLLSAGFETALSAGFDPDVAIASGKSLHNLPVAEHALALILSAARSLHTLTRAQIGHRWAAELGGVQQEPTPDKFTTLRNARVLIWGYGSIGRTLNTYLQMLGANVTGIASSRRTEDDVEVYTTDDLPRLLPQTDLLVTILPSSPSTESALGTTQLTLLPHHAWVVNVGRGTTIDEDALVAYLRARHIGGAALDVTRIEPTPVDSPLWDLPNVILTPHAAGGRPLGAEKLIEKNLTAWLNHEPLQNLVTIERTAP